MLIDYEDNGIYIYRDSEDVKIPVKRKEDAGYDIYPYFKDTRNAYVIPAHTTRIVNTGLHIALSPKYYAQLEERGSTGTKGIKISAGIIDSGYRGEIMVPITNTNEKDIVIFRKVKEDDSTEFYEKAGTYIIYPYEKAICQMIIHRVHDMQIKLVNKVFYDELESERGEGKLGSTGK